MYSPIRRTTLVLLPLLLLGAPAVASVLEPPGVRIQDEDELPDKRPEVKELCEALRGHSKKRGKEDREAIQRIAR
jgi:hypothetical protein